MISLYSLYLIGWLPILVRFIIQSYMNKKFCRSTNPVHRDFKLIFSMDYHEVLDEYMRDPLRSQEIDRLHASRKHNIYAEYADDDIKRIITSFFENEDDNTDENADEN